MNFLGIIPARYASTRFPGKALASLGNKPLIQHVYEGVIKILDNVYVATDDQRIFDAVKSFGGRVIMTSSAHQSGTDRCAEALNKIRETTGNEFDYVINFQGDEPFIYPTQIELLKSSFEDPQTDISTLVKQIDSREDILDPNKPKVVFDVNHFALYFTRSPVPFIRDLIPDNWPGDTVFYKHIGIYAYRSGILDKIAMLAPSSLEKAESLEQLRWLQNGYRIKVNVTSYENFGIDTPEDLIEACKYAERFNRK